ncbi:unnamed protein product [Rotaria sordida]|uniref:Pyruvate kinase n=1 Tax=Rotaria sordida TaxID=392033 RepID=A0A818PQM1_9BILA|nr:unnamed protein product [Rotaria sordida]CAF3627670.1 unnamed protein product [Rotaria sordida]
MSAKIITTLGPASGNPEVLQYFKEHSVEIARLNGSHGIIEEHIRMAKLAVYAGLDLMLDLPGPKIRLGEINDTSFAVKPGEKVIIENEKNTKKHNIIDKENNIKILPCQFSIEKSTKINDIVYIDDGKLQFRVLKVEANRIQAEALNSGLVKSHKGVNLPHGKIDIDFLTENDLRLIEKLLPIIKPKYVATSFVKTINDIHRLKKAIQDSLSNIKDYYPRIIVKIEMAEAIEPINITNLINECDMIMIARGDLALETTPVHIRVPFIQADLVQRCQKQNKPFIIATQILESMITCPVPTRAEVSDLYRAIVLDKANYIMLSSEAAVGQYPKECVTIMHDLIHYNKKNQLELNNSNKKLPSETVSKRSIKKIKTQNRLKSIKRKRL